MKKSIIIMGLIIPLLGTAVRADDNKISDDHDRFSGFIIAAGGYRISPHFSDLMYFRTDSDNDVQWIYNTYDRDVYSVPSGGGWSITNAINYNNSHFSTYAGYAFEKPLGAPADIATKAGTNIKLSPLKSPYQGLQLRLDAECRHTFSTGKLVCAPRAEIRSTILMECECRKGLFIFIGVVVAAFAWNAWLANTSEFDSWTPYSADAKAANKFPHWGVK